jgi:protein-tyrosine phosphatase
MRASYQEYAADFQDVAAEVFRLVLQQERLPMLVHCTAGKDRTGFIISLLQRTLGVPMDQVLDHYMVSNDSVKAFQETMAQRYRLFTIMGSSYEKFSPLMEAHREYLQAAYDLINRQFDSLDMYLNGHIGLSEEGCASLKRIFLEEPV